MRCSGAGVCEMFFGEGIWEFRAKTIVGIDQGIGETVLSETEYRGGKDLVAVLPKKGLSLLMFKFTGPDRIEETLVSAGAGAPCTMVRVGSSAATTQGNAAANAPSAAARAPVAQPPVQTANASPTPPVSSRPSPEVCRQTLLDKLGTVGVNQVRAMSDVRFKEAAIEGKVPNTNNLRIDLRGSACDDPRIKATLYDFDAAGMLQSITYVWERPPGPAPAPIFTERVSTLSRLHSLPPLQSPGRLQADTSMGRLVLQDMPERNLLLEAYAAKK